jgi:hypothetical protein
MGNSNSIQDNQENMNYDRSLSVIDTNKNSIHGATLVYNSHDHEALLKDLHDTLNTKTELFSDQSGGWKAHERFKTKDGRFGTVNFKRIEAYYINKKYYNVTFENGVTETLYPESDMFDPISPEERRRLEEEARKLEQQKKLLELKKIEEQKLAAQQKALLANKAHQAEIEAKKKK